MKPFIYQCDSIFCPTADLTLLTTHPTDLNNPLYFEAGQYVEALLDNGQRLLLSIANAPQRDGELVFHLRHNAIHPVAECWLNEVKQSGKLTLQGPFGHNTLARFRPDFDVIFLAGGTGFAPIRSLLMALSKQKTLSLNLKLFWGISHPENAYDLAFIDQIKAALTNFESHLILSDPIYFSQWNGPTGWAHDYCLQLIKTWEKTLVYASGPFAMIQAAFEAFTQKGLPASHFLSDMSMNA